VAIDLWGWSVFQVDGLAALLAAASLAAWGAYFAMSKRHVAAAYRSDPVPST
jgi:hypothetical protein